MNGAPLTHLDKVFWPEEGYTKGDLLAYYRDIAPVMLPYLRGRPESLHRHPDGIAGKGFFQKNVRRLKLPEGVPTVDVRSESRGETIRFMVCDDAETLLWMANLGCIEIDPWNSRVGGLDRPDYLVMDLDPEDAPFRLVIDAAAAVRETLDELGVAGYPKTSGGRGLHVYVPLGARYDYDTVRRFAELISRMAHTRLPDTTSLERPPGRRRGKVYFDFLQNKKGATTVAPYSVRPRPGAPVSAPLLWKEVRRGLDPLDFTIRTMRRRLDRIGDPFRPVLGKGADLARALRRLR